MCWLVERCACNGITGILIIVLDCGTLPNPVDGTVSHPTTTYGSEATFSCETGYTLSSTLPLTCQANGLWSGTSPTCDINGKSQLITQVAYSINKWYGCSSSILLLTKLKLMCI